MRLTVDSLGLRRAFMQAPAGRGWAAWGLLIIGWLTNPVPLLAQFKGLPSLDNIAGFSGLEPELEPVTVDARLLPGGPGAANGSYRLELRAKIVRPWHIYSLTQRSGGPLASKIALRGVATPPATAWQPDQPPKATTDSVYPGLPIEEHWDQVIWAAPISLQPGVEQVQGVLDVQACKESEGGQGGLCLQKSLEFTARLIDGAATGATPVSSTGGQGMATTAPSSASGEYALPPVATAILQGENIAWRGEVRWEVDAGTKTPRPVFTLAAEPVAGWHTYQLESVLDPKKLGYRPTLIALERAEGVELQAPQTATKVITRKVDLGKTQLSVPYYAGVASFDMPGKLLANVQGGSQSQVAWSGAVGYQVCMDETCLSAVGLRFDYQASLQPGELSSQLKLVPGDYSAAAKLAASPGARWGERIVARNPNANSGATDIALAKNEQAEQAQAGPISYQDLLRNMAAAFLAGMVLNCMPCVLPVVGLKVLAFVKQSKENHWQATVGNLLYVLGTLSVFWLMAGLIVGFSFGWGQQFQSFRFNLVMLALVWASALSLLGVWEMPILGVATSSRANQLASNKGYVGSFFKGVFTTLLATPCTGPVFLPTFTWALAQTTPTVFGAFTAMGLGMSFPFLLVIVFPGFAKLLPKPGAWMETFKQLMGFVMLGLVAWLFHVIHYQQNALTPGVFVFMLGIWGACWWIGRMPAGLEWGQQLRGWGVAGLICGAVGLFAFMPAKASEWEDFSSARLQQLLAEKKTVLIDFTAVWCVNCHYIKATVLDSKPVTDAVREQGVVRLLADITNRNPEIEGLMDQLGNKLHAIPFVAVVPGGNPQGTVALAGGDLTRTKILEVLKQSETGPNQVARGDSAVDR